MTYNHILYYLASQYKYYKCLFIVRYPMYIQRTLHIPPGIGTLLCCLSSLGRMHRIFSCSQSHSIIFSFHLVPISAGWTNAQCGFYTLPAPEIEPVTSHLQVQRLRPLCHTLHTYTVNAYPFQPSVTNIGIGIGLENQYQSISTSYTHI